MSNSARSVFVFGVYLGVLGAEVDDSLDKNGNTTKYWSAMISPGESKSLSFEASSKPASMSLNAAPQGTPKRAW